MCPFLTSRRIPRRIILSFYELANAFNFGDNYHKSINYSLNFNEDRQFNKLQSNI